MKSPSQPGREIWQFGSSLVYIDDGSPATPEDAKAFKEHLADEKVKDAEHAIKSEAENKAWHAKYDPSIREWFGLEADDELEYYSNDESLGYALSTSLFDRAGRHGYEDKEDLAKALAEMRKAFPDHWEETYEAWKEGGHDT